MNSNWERVSIGDISEKRNDFEEVDREASYEIVGVKRSGLGLAHKEAVRGDSMKFSKLLRLESGDLVYRVITAFEAPVTVVPAQDAGKLVTPQTFPVLRLNDRRILPEFMALLATYPSFHRAMAERCTGTVLRRKTLSVSAFQSIPIELPPLAEQQRIVDLIGSLDEAIEAAEGHQKGLMDAIEAWRDSIWSGIDRFPLERICSVDGSVVDPTLDENGRKPHVGIERIQSITGDLVNIQTAEEDGVVSGKYPFSPGHVIYSKIRPNLRKVAAPKLSGLCSSDVLPLSPAEGVPAVYLQQLLLSNPFTEAAVSRSAGTKMPRISKTELMSVMVPTIDLSEMSAASVRLTALNDARHSAEENLGSLRALRSELLTALLSGAHAIPESYDQPVLEIAA